MVTKRLLIGMLLPAIPGEKGADKLKGDPLSAWWSQGGFYEGMHYGGRTRQSGIKPGVQHSVFRDSGKTQNMEFTGYSVLLNLPGVRAVFCPIF